MRPEIIMRLNRNMNQLNLFFQVSFEPRKIFMNPATGRVYHPAPNLVGGIGLVKSSLAIEFSSLFTFDNGEEHGPTQFLWRDKKYDLDTEWYKDKSLKLSYKL